jgi:hypothetical protein
VVITSVWRYSLPVAAPRLLRERDAFDDPVGRRGDEPSKRETCRAFRTTGDAFLVVVEFLGREDGQVDVVLLERKRLVGSCIRTLMSRTNSLLAGTRRAAGPCLAEDLADLR